MGVPGKEFQIEPQKGFGVPVEVRMKEERIHVTYELFLTLVGGILLRGGGVGEQYGVLFGVTLIVLLEYYSGVVLRGLWHLGHLGAGLPFLGALLLGQAEGIDKLLKPARARPLACGECTC